ncbi:hypothetical protein PoB_000242400 [Plakobranchus ocellatus]|uniref:Uncharacterized protein n=1 Tax=Plakobranchus ocellatus TaxID=259542 RepID=A0AAV3Y125_9GAST|nr:hypothetical protein PoB_000242400 [Plakobranchus ocellatus]
MGGTSGRDKPGERRYWGGASQMGILGRGKKMCRKSRDRHSTTPIFLAVRHQSSICTVAWPCEERDIQDASVYTATVLITDIETRHFRTG